MLETQKITAHLPAELLAEAQEETGLGITETLKEGLEELRRKRVYRNLMRLKGTHAFSLDLDELRKDRDEP